MHFNNKLRAVFLAAVLTLVSGVSRAAPVNYSFGGAVDFGALSGEAYAGQFTFDDAALTGLGDELLPVSRLSFNFLGNAFNQTTSAAPPVVTFRDGNFLGLSFNVNTFTPGFALIPGFLDVTRSYFSYDNGTGNAGFGSLTYTVSTVPEPEILILMLTGLTLVGYAVHRRR